MKLFEVKIEKLRSIKKARFQIDNMLTVLRAASAVLAGD